MTPQQEIEVVYIVKTERDDLRRFNTEMRQIFTKLLEVAQVTPVDLKQFYEIVYEAAKSLCEQEILLGQLEKEAP